MTGDAKARCELAMMGKVVKCTNSEVLDCIKYIGKATETWGDAVKEKAETFVENLSKYKHRVKMMVCNMVYDDKCLTFLLETDDLPKPFETDYGSGYPCSYGYALNLSAPWCSEYGDSFYEKRTDGFYHRVS